MISHKNIISRIQQTSNPLTAFGALGSTSSAALLGALAAGSTRAVSSLAALADTGTAVASTVAGTLAVSTTAAVGWEGG